MRNYIAEAGLAFGFALFCFTGSIAVASDASVLVHIVDAVTKQPVRLVRVVVSAESARVGYTDRNGTASFEKIPPGHYFGRFVRQGYQAVSDYRFDLSDSQQTTLEVVFAPLEALKTIGSVKASSRPKLSTSEIANGSAVTRLAGGSLLGALSNGEFDPHNGLISIDGHDPTQTAVSIDGVEIGSAALPTDLRGLNVDLFGGASLSQSSSSALGGTLDLVTLEPTVAPETSGVFTYGTAGQSLIRSWLRASLGRVGVVLAHANSGMDGRLRGDTFRDGSGLLYKHASGAGSRGDLLKVRVPLSSRQVVTFTGLTSAAERDAICERISGPLPCGIGPGNSSTTNTNLGLIRYDLNGEVFGMSLSAVQQRVRFDENLLKRYANGLANPAENRGANDVQSISGNFRITRLTTKTNLKISAQRVVFQQNIVGQYSTAGSGTISLINGVLSHQFDFGSAARVTSTALFERNFLDNPLGAQIDAFWTPRGSETFTVRSRIQNGGAPPIRSGSLSDPVSLLYDCNSQTVFGRLPGDRPTRSSVSETSIGWSRRTNRGTIQISASEQTQRGTSVSTILNGGDVDLPVGYLDAITRFYGTQEACGANRSLVPSDLYFTTAVGGVQRRYESARLSFSRQFGASLASGGYLRFTDARVVSNDRRLISNSSVTIPGRQIPNVPRWRGGLVFDLKYPTSPVEYLALAQYVGPNNANNLPSYMTVALGASYERKNGTLTVAATNIFGAYPGKFSSPRYAVPITQGGGGSLSTIAEPLPKTSLSVSYSFRTGGRRDRQTVPPGNVDASQQISVFFRPLPRDAPVAPFQIDSSDTNCQPERLRDATRLMDAVRNASFEVERSRSLLGQYPASLDLSGLATGSENLEYRPTDDSYAIQIKLPTLFALGLACIPVAAAGDVANAVKAGAYVDASLPNHAMEYEYMPRFGIYVVFHQGVVKAPQKQPVAAQTDVLSVRSDCPDSERPLIAETLTAIRESEISTKQVSRKLENGSQIIASSDGSASLFEIVFPDALTDAIFRGCIYKKALSRANLLRDFGISKDHQGRLLFFRPEGFVEVEK